MDKHFSKAFALCIATILSALLITACVQPVIIYQLSDGEGQTYVYGDVIGMELDLPVVLAGDNRTPLGLDKLSWSVESGTSAILLDKGKFMLNGGESGAGESGSTVFKVSIKDGKNRATLRYTVDVEGGFSNALNWNLTGVNYSLNPGIAKSRVFGNKNISLVDRVPTITPNTEQVTLIPNLEYFSDITNQDYLITVSNPDVLDYRFDGQNKLTLSFNGIGESTLRVELDREDEKGDTPLLVYKFTVVDGINVSTMSELQAVQSLVKYNTESNQYSYSGKTPNYTGWDGKNFENIVLRNNITNIDDITLFYGSVYGNGYTLDATPYAESNRHNHPTKDEIISDGNEKTASFYLMSDNTILDNVILVGTNNHKENLNLYYETKNVLGVYGTLDTIYKQTDIHTNDTNGDGINDKARIPKNIKILNSILEKGRNALTVYGSADKNNPVLVESSVLRYTGEFGLRASSWWSVEQELWTKIESNGDGVYQGKKLPAKTFVTLKNIIITETKQMPINMQNGYDNYGSARGDNYAHLPSYGTELTVLGDYNYLFSWLKVSEVDFGQIMGFEIKPIMDEVLADPDNKEFVDRVTYIYGNSPNVQDNHYMNLSILSNYILDMGQGFNTQPNTINFEQSNLKDFWTVETLNVTVLGTIHNTVEQVFAKKDIDNIPNAPTPQDDLSSIVPQRIREIPPAQAA